MAFHRIAFQPTTLAHAAPPRPPVRFGASSVGSNSTVSDCDTFESHATFTNEAYWPPILNAAKRGDFNKLQDLLNTTNANVETECPSTGTTPLIAAAESGHLQAVKLLIDHNAQLEHGDSNDRTPLYIAVLEDNLPMVKLLLQAGANPEAKDCQQHTPLSIALEQGPYSMALALLNYTPPSPSTIAHYLTCARLAALENDRATVINIMTLPVMEHLTPPPEPPLGPVAEMNDTQMIWACLRRLSPQSLRNREIGLKNL